MGMKKKEINYQLLIRRICLIVLDIICIIAASILALLTRFEFDFSQIPKEFLKVIYKYGPFTIVITLIIFSLFRIYSSLWEYAGIEEVFSLIAACLVAAVAKIVIILFTWSVMPRSWYVLDTIYLMILIGATRVSYRLIRLRRQNRTFPWSKRKKVMIIGGGEAGRSLITEIQNSKYLDQKVVCIIDDDPYKIGRYIKGVKVVGNRNSIKKSVKKYNVQQIILTIPSANEISWDIRFIQSFLEEEKKYAIELSQLLNVTLSVINTSSDNKKNIILPIAPQYIEKILSGEKKYEYRKRLCKNNISRMYLYATAPVKGIVGEAEVIGKLEKNPKDLWNLTFQDSGIKVELFYKYFENYSRACAYKLGTVTRYANIIPLHNIGIDYIIQSFKYISDI